MPDPINLNEDQWYEAVATLIHSITAVKNPDRKSTLSLIAFSELLRRQLFDLAGPQKFKIVGKKSDIEHWILEPDGITKLDGDLLTANTKGLKNRYYDFLQLFPNLSEAAHSGIVLFVRFLFGELKIHGQSPGVDPGHKLEGQGDQSIAKS